MALNLNNHLLEAPDGLFAAFLGHLLRHVVLGLVEDLAALLLALFWNIGRSLFLEVLGSSCRPGSGDILVRARGLLPGCLCIFGGGLGTILAEWLVLVVLVLDRALDARDRGHIVPGIVIGRFVNLTELFLARLKPGCSILCTISSNVTEKDCGVVDFSRC